MLLQPLRERLNGPDRSGGAVIIHLCRLAMALAMAVAEGRASAHTGGLQASRDTERRSQHLI